MNKLKTISEEEKERIIKSGIKKVVDKETYQDNLCIGSCSSCIKTNTCTKGIESNWNDDCEEWENFLDFKEE